MEVTVDIDDETKTVTIDGDTYGDVLRAVGLSPQAATVLVDGRPVPAEDPVTEDHVRILRLIAGGSGGSVVRFASEPDANDVIATLDSAMLEVDRDLVREAIRNGDVLVAGDDHHIRGAAVLDEATITAIGVHPADQGQGIGSALIDAAQADRGRLTAEFGDAAHPFYDALGFDITQTDDRYVGSYP